MLKLPPRQAFPHEISYKRVTGQDVWGKPEYSVPVSVQATRVDEQYDFKRSGTNATDKMPNALIVMFKKYNYHLPSFENGGLVTYKGKERTIVAVIPLCYLGDEIIGYELEVV